MVGFCSLVWLLLLWPLDRSRSTRGLKTSPTIEAPLDRVLFSCAPVRQSYVLCSSNLCTCPFKALAPSFKDAGMHAAVWGSVLTGCLWWTTIYNEARPTRRTAGRRFNKIHPGAFLVQTPFVFVKAVYRLIVAQLFISTQWDVLHVCAGERFSMFAVSGKQHVCSQRGPTHQVLAGNIFFCGYRDITHIDTSVTTVYSHNLHLEKLQITAGFIIENASKTYNNNDVFWNTGELNAAHHTLRVRPAIKYSRRRRAPLS